MGETRHTFASHLVMRGTNLHSVQELLGHKTGKKTVRYTHLSTPHLQGTVNWLDSPLGRLLVGSSRGGNLHMKGILYWGANVMAGCASLPLAPSESLAAH